MQSQSTQVIMALLVRWKKPVKLAITLDPESVDGSYDMGNNTSDSYIKVEMPINSFNRQFIEGSNRAAATYVCTYQGASGKPTNV